jgi:hypothetical protein
MATWVDARWRLQSVETIKRLDIELYENVDMGVAHGQFHVER